MSETRAELSGALAEGALPAVLRALYVERRTGLLHVTHDADRGSVCFVEGHIVWGDTTVEECHMGETLVRHGLLGQEHLDRAGAVVTRTKKRLGEVLVEMGVLDGPGLEEALGLHVREVLRCVFSWAEGSYAFADHPPETFRGYDRALSLSTGEVILDAVWSVADPDVVRYALGDLDRVVVSTSDPLLRFQRITLTPTDGFILSRVDGTLTAREILEIAPVSLEEAHRSFYGLLCVGMIEYVTRAPRVPEPSTDGTRDLVLDTYRHLATRNHFEVLLVPRTATEAEIKAAFFHLAKLIHPDAHHQDARLADLRRELSAVFARLTEAHRVLSEPGSRAAYEAGLVVAGIKPEPEPEGLPPAPPPPDPVADRQRAEDAMRSAEEQFAGGRYFDAIAMVDREVLAVARGRLASRARVLKAKAYLKNPQWRKQAEDELNAVAREDPGYAEAHFVLGTIYRAGGAPARAAAMFRKTLDLKPRHAGALAELGALEGGGIFKKLLGRG
ncbi:MAG: DnaJ domain-containing protein [Acidobacteria bacterium]|nr:DnaJ domain-containing protein [Acidobacteriota bacterium]